LITGVSQGLGLATAAVVLDAGDSVIGVSRRLTPEFGALQERYKGRARFIAADLALPDAAETVFVAGDLKSSTPLHGYVNNAAVAYDDLITNLRIEPLQSMFALNVFTPMVFVRQVIRNMLLHGTAGSIVHVSSISVHTGYKGLAMYAASKGALEAFSKNTAREWGERKIRSNTVVAGFMETSMSATLSSEQKDRIYKRTCLKQPTDVVAVAETIQFLLSDKASSITGQNTFVDSGTI
jgi:3-oxoacyl-[acyl-carrier protein] reductase